MKFLVDTILTNPTRNLTECRKKYIVLMCCDLC